MPAKPFCLLCVVVLAVCLGVCSADCSDYVECGGCQQFGCDWCEAGQTPSCVSKGTCPTGAVSDCPGGCSGPQQSNCFDCVSSNCSWAQCSGPNGRNMSRCINASITTMCDVRFDAATPCTSAQCEELAYCTDCLRHSDVCSYCTNASCVPRSDDEMCDAQFLGPSCSKYCSSFSTCLDCQFIAPAYDDERPGCAWSGDHCFDVVLHPFGESVEFQQCSTPTPAPPTSAPPECSSERHFDTPSFFGGLILAFGIVIIGYFLIVHCGKARHGYVDLDKVADPPSSAPAVAGTSGAAGGAASAVGSGSAINSE